MMRKRRFSHINAIIDKIIAHKGRCHILDIGGSEYYWRINDEFIERHQDKLKIFVSNIGDKEDEDSGHPLFHHIIGDATKPETMQGDFDFLHSNSVIEHVGAWANIRAMANAIVASAKPYYVQTPNFWFPIEPHFRTIGFQWLPEYTRARMLMRKQRGFRSAHSYDEAMLSVQSVHLLTRGEMRELFPDAEIRLEYVGPLVKSIMAIRDFTHP